VLPQAAYAQGAPIDSLHRVLRQQLADTTRVNVQLQLARFYWYRQPDSANYYTQKALGLAIKIKYRKGEALAYNSMAAIRLLNGEDPGALEYFFQSLTIRQQLNDWQGVASSLNNIGFAYMQQDNISLASAYLHRALAIHYKYNDIEGLGYSKNNLGELMLKSNRYDSAAWYLYGALAMWKQTGNLQAQIITENNIGFVHLHDSCIDSAKYYFEKSLRAADLLQDKRARSRALIGLASIAQHRQHLQETIRFAEQAYQTAGEIHEARYTIQAAQLLASAYEQSGDYLNAIKYLKIAAAANEKILRMEKDKKARELSYEYEKKAAEKEIEKELANAKAQKYAIAMLTLILLIVVVLSVVLWHKSKETVRHNEVLRQSYQQITLLNTQLQQTLATVEQQKNAIEEQAKQLQKIDKTKNKLFAIISHDLQTPIKSLYTILLMLDNKEIKPNEMKVLLKHLKNNIKGLSETMENLLAWAKVQMRGDTIKPTDDCVNVCETVQLQMQLFAELLARKKIHFINNIPPSLSVGIESEHLRIVLRNLIANAIKFTNPFGEITLYAEHDTSRQLVTIFVRDNGIGIAPEKQMAVFSDIARLPRRGTAGESGSGLGLAFCKELVEKSGGSIGFYSEKGVGSTFYIILPSACNTKDNLHSQDMMAEG
jgi:signal transduction histidine kinase